MKPTTTVLLVDDDAAFRGALSGELARMGFDTTTAGTGTEAIAVAERSRPDVVLLDLQLPDLGGLEVLKILREKCASSEVIMLTGHGTIDSAIESIRIGAFDYASKPCPLDEIELRIRRAIERRSLRHRTKLLERGLTPADPGDSFVGGSEAFRRVLHLIDRVAPTDATVLITGETGSGKEMAAKLLHARSHRRDRPFVVVECAALQEELLQSELFGHERGAFTGAEREKAGLFEVAHGGTILLDEIGEVSQATQVKLLRVLDTSTFRHVGGNAEIRVDARVIAATNRDLPSMVRQGLFREDLYYRLRTVTIQLPPLRERREDIGLLAEHFVARFGERFGTQRTIPPETLEILEKHEWPGNVRELLHVIEAAMVVSEGTRILPEHLPAALRTSAPSAAREPAEGESLPTIEELEREHIRRVLRATHGHRGNAAKILGISERNLYRKLREYGLL